MKYALGDHKGRKMLSAQLREETITPPTDTPHVARQIGLEEYYSEAGPDYAVWSREFNMHFGYYRAGENPPHREAMLESLAVHKTHRPRRRPNIRSFAGFPSEIAVAGNSLYRFH